MTLGVIWGTGSAMGPETREVSGFWRAETSLGKPEMEEGPLRVRVRRAKENALCPRGDHCQSVPRVPRHRGRNSLISKLDTGEEHHTFACRGEWDGQGETVNAT